MICLKCREKITATNRQTYKLGLRIPYCTNCVQAYINSKHAQDIARMNPEQRTTWLRRTKKELEQKNNYTKEELLESHDQLRTVGLTDTEIVYLMENLKPI